MTDLVQADPEVGYDLFISYRSAKSGAHAHALRDALYALDKRHAGERPMRIFLDRVSLRAGQLERNIDSGLLHSRSLVVLLDETTLQSNWVNDEIRDWLAAGSRDRLFLVRTGRDLDLSWDAEKKDFRHPDALPSALSGVFKVEQKYIDFVVPPRRVDEVDLIGLYSTVMDVDPESLGEDERRHLQQQRRRSRRFNAILGGALVASLVAGGVAVVNYTAAQASARQARSDALAAESLLNLQSSPADAIDKAVQASELGSGTSIRSALLAVAAETRRLQRTFSLTRDGSADSLRGVSLSADDKLLTAWGPAATGQGTAVVTWSVDSGDVLQRFSIPRPSVAQLVEVPGVAYLGCAAGEALRIDWHSHELRVLSSGDSCDARLFLTGGATQTFLSADVDGKVVGVTATGEEFAFEGGLDQQGARTATAMLAFQGDRPAGFVTSRGFAKLPVDGLISLPGLGQGTLVMRGKDSRYHLFHATGPGTVTDTIVQPPENAAGLASWQDYEGTPRAAWITEAGVVGWSGSAATLTLRDIGPLSAGKDPLRPKLAAVGSDALLATVGTTAYTVRFGVGDPSATRLAEAISAQTDISIQQCGPNALLLGAEQYYAAGQLHSGRAELWNCLAVEPGPQVKVQGSVVMDAAYASRQYSDVTANAELVLGREDGVVSLFSAHDGDAVPWRVTARIGGLLAPDGTTILENGAKADDDTFAIHLAEGRRTLGPAGLGSWVAGRPDGRGGIYKNASGAWLGVVGDVPQMLAHACSEGAFEPAPGFTTSVAAAEAQVAVRRTASIDRDLIIDCITGDNIADAPRILAYAMPAAGTSHIVSQEGANLRVTTWRHGEAAITTTDVPGTFGNDTAATLDATGDRLVAGSRTSGGLVVYARDGATWRAAAHLANSSGLLRDVAYSPNGAFVMSLGPAGQFDIFDAATGRRLASQSAALSSTGTIYRGLALRQRGGFLEAYLRDSDDEGTLVEIPIDAQPLRELLCNVHESSVCRAAS